MIYDCNWSSGLSRYISQNHPTFYLRSKHFIYVNYTTKFVLKKLQKKKPKGVQMLREQKE